MDPKKQLEKQLEALRQTLEESPTQGSEAAEVSPTLPKPQEPTGETATP